MHPEEIWTAKLWRSFNLLNEFEMREVGGGRELEVRGIGGYK